LKFFAVDLERHAKIKSGNAPDVIRLTDMLGEFIQRGFTKTMKLPVSISRISQSF
jgi:hypothetical protein